MKKRIVSLLCVLAMSLSMVVSVGATEARTFPDVTETDWFYPYVMELVELGSISGYPDGTFGPMRQVALIELSVMALGALKIDDPTFEESLIDGTSKVALTNGEEYWGNRYIAAANMLGVHEFGVTKERWEQPATREEMVWLLSAYYSAYVKSMLYYRLKAAHLIGDYETAVKGSPYEDAILWFYSEGIIVGVNENGDFAPKNTATRAEAATMLLNLLYPERWKVIDWSLIGDMDEEAEEIVDSGDLPEDIPETEPDIEIEFGAEIEPTL